MGRLLGDSPFCESHQCTLWHPPAASIATPTRYVTIDNRVLRLDNG